MRELKKLDSGAEFAFTGGDYMIEVSNCKPAIHIREMNFMGFIDVLKNIATIKKNFKKVKKDILAFKPDLLVLVDYPGFNLRMAKWAHQHQIKTDYYISPTVWAWKENRVNIIKQYIHKLFVILPFEEAFYAKHNLKVHFIGHPLVDAIEFKKPQLKSKELFVTENKLSDKPIIAILPGSRKQEIERMLNVMLDVTSHFPNYQFVVAGSNSLDQSNYQILSSYKIPVVYNQTYELLSYATAGIIKSGTSTLESALLNLPQVICYKGGNLSFKIAKKLVDVKYIGLPNLIMDAPLVKELVQDDFTISNIIDELKKLLFDKEYIETMLINYQKLRAHLGGTGASARLAQALYHDVNIKN